MKRLLAVSHYRGINYLDCRNTFAMKFAKIAVWRCEDEESEFAYCGIEKKTWDYTAGTGRCGGRKGCLLIHLSGLGEAQKSVYL